MSSGGMKIGLKGFSPVLDSVFGMRDGSVKQQASADLSTQLLSAGPLANVLAATSGNVVFFASKAAMDAAHDYSAPQAAWVFADPNPANNAVYYFTNGDPGYWSFMLNFPASWIYATVSGGTANEIELSMAGTVSRSTMIFFEVSEDNLGGGVTISVNDSDPMTVLDFRGDPLEAGALAEGALAVFFPVGDGTARMVIDNTATAAAAASAASAASANTSALAASDSAGASEVSAARSQRFAVAPEDEETSPGSGLYSAFHWARKAASVVLGPLADQIIAAASAVPGASDVFAFVENSSGSLKKISQANLIAKFINDGDLATKSGAETLTNKKFPDFNGGSVAGLRNRLLNYGGEIIQRGSATIAAGASAYVFDRWLIKNNTNQSVTVSQNLLALASGFAMNARNTMRFAFAAAPTSGTLAVEQRIEYVTSIKPGAWTLTSWMSGPAGAESLAAEITQNFGTGGAPSASVTTPMTFAGASPTTIYSATTNRRCWGVTIPALTGKILGTAGNDFLAVSMVLTPRQSGNYDLTWASFVHGDASGETDPISARDLQEEIAHCQRFFAKSYPRGVVPGTITSTGQLRVVAGGGAAFFNISFPVEMRASPTFLVWNPVTGSSGTYRSDPGANNPVTASEIGTRGGNVSGVGTNGNWAYTHWTAEIEL